MNIFENSLLRLKEQLGAAADKDVAERLGLSDKALNARKRRDSFPIKEVFALAAQQPELGLDPDWIVTGISSRMETEDRGEAHLLQCYRLMNAHDRKNMNKIAAAISDVVNLSGEEIERRLSNYKGGIKK